MAKMNVQNLSDSERKLMALTMAHIGSNGNAHQIATNDEAGFMSTDDRYQITTKFRCAQGVDPGVDINTLDFGVYFGRGFLNAPPIVGNEVCLVEITGWNDSKKIEFTWLIKNITYVRTITQGVDSGWPNNDFINLIPMNGFTGNIMIRRNQTLSGFEVEIVFELKCNLTDSNSVQFATIPTGYPATTSNFIPPNIGIRGQFSDGTNTTAMAMISGGNKLICYRNDGEVLAGKVLTTISGQIKYTR